MNRKNDYYTIYGLKLKNDIEVRYVGLTSYLLKFRLKSHLKDKVNPHKMYWLKKHKDNIEIIPIEENIFILQEACEKEIYYIKEYKNNGNRLLNYSEGGSGHQGRKVSDEVKEKISKKLKGRIRPEEEINKSKKTKKENKYNHSKNVKNKMSISKKGDKNPMFGKLGNGAKTVYQYDLNGYYIREFESIANAKKESFASKILRVIKGTQKHSGGFYWSFSKLEKIDIKKEEYTQNITT